jgi:hypothetical protein
VGIVATGFLREAGKELWAAMKRRYFPPPPPPPKPVQVDLRFKPIMFEEHDCVWARHENVSRLESEGYTFYPHPSNGGNVVRGYDREASFLMVKPGVQKKNKA